jgi:hypothetical protein
MVCAAGRQDIRAAQLTPLSAAEAVRVGPTLHKICLLLFDTNNRIFGSYLAAICRILTSAMAWQSAIYHHSNSLYHQSYE